MLKSQGGGDPLKEEAHFREVTGFDVQPFSGEVRGETVDLAIPGRGLDFVWARTYQSGPRQTQGSTFGERWTHSYDVNIQPLGGGIVIHDGTGRADTFKLQSNGVYTCPEFFREGTLSNNVFRLTFADTGYWEFNPARHLGRRWQARIRSWIATAIP